jgi:hypothetical protein
MVEHKLLAVAEFTHKDLGLVKADNQLATAMGIILFLVVVVAGTVAEQVTPQAAALGMLVES